jgi:hypothetical protein
MELWIELAQHSSLTCIHIGQTSIKTLLTTDNGALQCVSERMNFTRRIG